MSMYRTVTVTPQITSRVTASATITPVLVTVIPSLYDEIEVEPSLSNSVVDITPTLSENAVNVTPEYFTTVRTYGGEVDFFRGDYEYTPTQGTQVVNITGLLATQNITINPIPSNYGLIGWNGSVLTVS